MNSFFFLIYCTWYINIYHTAWGSLIEYITKGFISKSATNYSSSANSNTKPENIENSLPFSESIQHILKQKIQTVFVLITMYLTIKYVVFASMHVSPTPLTSVRGEGLKTFKKASTLQVYSCRQAKPAYFLAMRN
jgi:hypothetical protein